MKQLPIITQALETASPQDAVQFVESPVIAISDAPPVARGGAAQFTVSLLDSDPPVRVRVYIPDSTPSTGAYVGPCAVDSFDITTPHEDYLNFDETITLNQADTTVAISTAGGTPPFDDPTTFNVYLQAVGPAYIVAGVAVGTIEGVTNYTVYQPGVYADGTYI